MLVTRSIVVQTSIANTGGIFVLIELYLHEKFEFQIKLRRHIQANLQGVLLEIEREEIFTKNLYLFKYLFIIINLLLLGKFYSNLF